MKKLIAKFSYLRISSAGGFQEDSETVIFNITPAVYLHIYKKDKEYWRKYGDGRSFSIQFSWLFWIGGLLFCYDDPFANRGW